MTNLAPDLCQRMSLEKKTKTALDEARLLVMGSTILLGFQFESVFQDAFHSLASHAKSLDGIALILMVTSIALLVAPSFRHRIAEDGHVSAEMLGIISVMAGFALFPFALSLGVDIFIVIERLYTTMPAVGAGLVFTALALWFWYGLQFSKRAIQRQGQTMAQTDRIKPALAVRIEQMLTEARVLLPGAQALLGFQLIIVLTASFVEIPAASKFVHALALGAIALAIVLLMAPAAYHRIVYKGDDTEDMYRTGSRFIAAASVPLGLGITGDVYVTIERIFHSPAIALAAGVLAFVVLFGLWIGYPLMARQRLSPSTKPRSARRSTA
jgi:hypothetical protein